MRGQQPSNRSNERLKFTGTVVDVMPISQNGAIPLGTPSQVGCGSGIKADAGVSTIAIHPIHGNSSTI